MRNYGQRHVMSFDFTAQLSNRSLSLQVRGVSLYLPIEGASSISCKPHLQFYELAFFHFDVSSNASSEMSELEGSLFSHVDI